MPTKEYQSPAKKPPSRVLRYVLLALVLVIVFLVSAMTAMRLAIHGREAAVPKLVGMSAAEADSAAESSGLQLEVENRFYSAEVPAGHILSQEPPPGAIVRRGWKIRAAESLGTQRVEIPNVVGQSERAAEINLARRGLQLGKTAVVHLENVSTDQVIAQSPPPKAEDVASPQVNLLLTAPVSEAAPGFVMPDFVGKTFGEAGSSIAEAGFKLGETTVFFRPGSPLAGDAAARNRPIATDVIVGQTPAAGQKVTPAEAISFHVLR